MRPRPAESRRSAAKLRSSKRPWAREKKSVTWGQTEPFTSSWDPSGHTILAQIYFDFDVFGQLIRTPMTESNRDEIIYELATSQKVVEDGWLEYTLRKDVKFHNGQPFTARDVKATFEYASNPERPAGTWYPGQAEVHVIDDYTCRVRGADNAYPGSLFWFLAGFLPILSADDIENKAIDEFPNGCGSYKFISRDGQPPFCMPIPTTFAASPRSMRWSISSFPTPAPDW